MSRERTAPLGRATADPLVATAACFVAGIALCRLCDPGLAVAYGLAAAAFLGWILWEGNLTLQLFALAAGALLHLFQTGADRSGPFFDRIESDPLPVTATGVVVSPPTTSPGTSPPRTRFHLGVERMESGGVAAEAYGNQIAVDLRDAPPLTYGDRLRLRGDLEKPEPPRNPASFDYAGFLRGQGIHAELWGEGRDLEKLESGRGNPLVAVALRARGWLSAQLTRGLGADDGEAGKLICAMALGLRDEAPAHLEDKFRLSGTLHVFAVSGLHVGIVAAVAWFAAALLAAAAGLPRGVATAAAIGAMVAYAMVTGLRPSACRAAVMGSIFFAGTLVGREPRVLNSAAAAALAILLLDTGQLFRPGFQLSFLVLLSIATLAKPACELLSRPFRPDPFLPAPLVTRRRRAVAVAGRHGASLAGVSAAAWAGAALLGWLYFGLATPVSIVANILLVPLAFIVLGTAAFAVALALVPHPLPAELANEANALWAKTAAAAAGAFSELPGGHWALPSPGHLTRDDCELTILDLPHGGAAAHIALRGGGDWLIDCGAARSFEPVIRPQLLAHAAGRPDGLLLTHGDGDHAGGALPLIREYPPGQLFTTPADSTSPSWKAALSAARSAGIPVRRPSAGGVIELGQGHALHVLYPPAGGAPGFVADDRCLVVQLRLANGRRILFLADSGYYAERWLLDHAPPESLRSQVLVRGHHDSDVSGLPGLVEAIAPQVVVAGRVARRGAAGRPRTWASDLGRQGIAVFDQAEAGAVLVRAEGDRTTVTASLTGRSVPVSR